MGRKSKISYEEKIKACEDYISGKCSLSDIAEALPRIQSFVLFPQQEFFIRHLFPVPDPARSMLSQPGCPGPGKQQDYGFPFFLYETVS